MRVDELSRDDLIRLKQLYMIAVSVYPPTYDELANADETIADDEMMAVYGFVDIPDGFYIPEREGRFKHLVKINLSGAPDDSYPIEGIWAFVDDRGKEAYDNDESGTYYDCVLDNASTCWRGLYPGAVLKIETRGEQRPIVPFEWLEERYEFIA